jgi:hypothetical protein
MLVKGRVGALLSETADSTFGSFVTMIKKVTDPDENVPEIAFVTCSPTTMRQGVTGTCRTRR